MFRCISGVLSVFLNLCIDVRNAVRQKWAGHVYVVATPL